MTKNSVKHTHQNGGFKSRFGFVLACVGSAVGMGNIWMFPYRLGQYGGGAFLIPYLIFIALFGFVGLSAEFAIGRLAKTGTLGSYEYCWESRKKGKIGLIIGWIPLLGSLGIAIGYSVIIGWVLRFLGGSVTGAAISSDTSGYFSQSAVHFGNIPWHLLGIALAIGLLYFGATKGIEKINRILMPAFFILFGILAIRVALLPGAIEGYKFLFLPDWNKLLEVDTWVMAMGQAFFSLSITGSGMIVYGSYLKKDEDIPKASIHTAIFDTIAAMLAALAIMPAVFSYGIEPTAGPPLMFITLPHIFAQMPFGQLFAVLFFLSVAFAGITSLINMFEAVIESWQHKFRLPRPAAVLLCGVITIAVSIFLEGEASVGAWMDFVTIIITPFGAVLGAISVYYILGYKKIQKELNQGRVKPVSQAFKFLSRYIYVPIAVIVFILGIIYGGIG